MDTVATADTTADHSLSILGERLHAGDESALGQILAALGPQTLQVLRYHFSTLDEADLDDAIAVAAYRIWESRSRFNPRRGALRGWFFAVARNAARDLLRSKKKQVHTVSLDTLDVASSRVAGSPPAEPPRERAATDSATDPLSERQLMLRTHLGLLPDADRAILLAWADDAKGKSTAELAAEFNLTPEAVRQRRSRLLHRVRSLADKSAADRD